MKARDILQLLNRIESQFPVDTWVINDIHVWPIIRLDMMFSLHFLEDKSSSTEINTLFKIRQVMRMTRNYLWFCYSSLIDRTHNDHLSQVDVLFLGDTDGRTKINDKWYDRFCDPLVEYFNTYNISTLVLEKSQQYLIPRYRKSHYIQPQLDREMCKSAIKKTTNHDREKLDQFNEFINYLEKENLDIPLPTKERLYQIMQVILSYETYFENILLKTKPSLAFTVSYSNPIGLAFNLACHTLGIQTVDIQHGVQGECNGAYGRWQKVPKEGYELLPTFFMCWSQDEEKAITSWSKKIKEMHRPIVTGNLFLQSWLKGKNDFNSFYKKRIDNKKGKVNILVTFSPIDAFNERLLKIIVDAIRSSNSNWKWWIRLHPVGLNKKDTIKNFFNDNNVLQKIEIDMANSLPLYALLEQMDVHITYNSAAVYEAEAFSIPSIVTSADNKEYFSKQIRLKTTIFVDNKRKIYQSVNDLLRKKFPSKVIKKEQKDGLLYIKNLVYNKKKLNSYL